MAQMSKINQAQVFVDNEKNIDHSQPYLKHKQLYKNIKKYDLDQEIFDENISEKDKESDI